MTREILRRLFSRKPAKYLPLCIAIVPALMPFAAGATDTANEASQNMTPATDICREVPANPPTTDPPCPVHEQARSDTNIPAKTGLLVTALENADHARAIQPMITVRPAGTMAGQPMALSENPAMFVLKPGDYDVTVRTEAESETAPRRVSVQQGKISEITLDLTPGVLELTFQAGGKPLSRTPSTQFRCNAQIMGYSSEVPARFTAIAGIYQARLQLMGSQAFDIPNLEIRAGATNALVIEVPCARLDVYVNGRGYAAGSNPLPYVELDRNGRMVTALTANPAKFHILSGAYEVFVREDDRRLGLKWVALEPGQETDITIELPAEP